MNLYEDNGDRIYLYHYWESDYSSSTEWTWYSKKQITQEQWDLAIQEHRNINKEYKCQKDKLWREYIKRLDKIPVPLRHKEYRNFEEPIKVWYAEQELNLPEQVEEPYWIDFVQDKLGLIPFDSYEIEF